MSVDFLPSCIYMFFFTRFFLTFSTPISYHNIHFPPISLSFSLSPSFPAPFFSLSKTLILINHLVNFSITGRKEMFYLTMHITHFIYGYVGRMIKNQSAMCRVTLVSYLWVMFCNTIDYHYSLTCLNYL